MSSTRISTRISQVFGVPNDYNLEQLKSSYINIIEKLSKSDKTILEKELLLEQYKKLYTEGKELFYYRNIKNNNNIVPHNDFLNHHNQFTQINNYFKQIESKLLSDFNNSNVFSFSKSYNSTLNPDGSYSVIERNSESKNGKKNNIIKAYKKMPDGKIIPFTQEQLEQLKQLKN
jgi:hypothetical protein